MRGRQGRIAVFGSTRSRSALLGTAAVLIAMAPAAAQPSLWTQSFEADPLVDPWRYELSVRTSETWRPTGFQGVAPRQRDDNAISFKGDVNVPDVMSFNIESSHMELSRAVGNDVAGFVLGDSGTFEKNWISDSKLTLGLLDDRLRLTSRLGWSGYGPATPDAPDLSAPQNWSRFFSGNDTGGGLRFSDQVAEGHATLNRLDLDVIEHDTLGFSVFGKHTRVDDEYRDIRRLKKDPFATTNREAVAFGGKLDLRPLTLQLSGESAWDAEADKPSALGSRRQGYDATVSLDLHDVRSRIGGDSDGRFWSVLPGSIWVGYGQGEVRHATDYDGPADQTMDWNAGLSWNWDRAQGSISYWHSRLDNRQPGAETADWVGDGVNLGLGLYRDIWNFDAFLSFGRYANLDPWSNSIEYDIGGGVSADVLLKKFPDISASLYLGRFDGRYYAYEGTSLYDNWELEIAFDFSKYLAGSTWKDKPSLKLLYRVDGAGSSEDYSGSSDQSREIGHMVGLWFQTKLFSRQQN